MSTTALIVRSSPSGPWATCFCAELEIWALAAQLPHWVPVDSRALCPFVSLDLEEVEVTGKGL